MGFGNDFLDIPPKEQATKAKVKKKKSKSRQVGFYKIKRLCTGNHQQSKRPHTEWKNSFTPPI